MAAISEISFATIGVRDLEATARFYREAFGYESSGSSPVTPEQAALWSVPPGMRAQQCCSTGCDSGAHVFQMGAVGGPHFNQPCAGLFHHVGQAEASADLDQLTAGHDDFTAAGQRGQGQQQGTGGVVHHQGGLRAANLGQ